MPNDPQTRLRRTLIGLAIALSVALVAGESIYAYAFLVEPHQVQTTQVPVPISCLPRSFDGLRIAQLSDLHLGPVVDRSMLAAAVDKALALQPDIFVLTGDFVSSLDKEEALSLEAEMGRLKAPLGTYAVLGNHDYWTDAATVTGAIRRSGAVLLSNQAIALQRGADTLYVVGVDDVWEEHADLGLALTDVPADGCAVLLVHEPDFADEVSRDSKVALQLSGHSHGGQIHMPLVPQVLPAFAQRYPEGLARAGNLYVYTNRGIGLLQPAARFRCPPEITLVELRPA